MTLVPTLAPAIVSLNPNTARAGDPAFSLTVTGRGFVNGSRVRWGGADRATTFVSSTQLLAAIAAADVSEQQAVYVTVVNPEGSATGGVATRTSNRYPFYVTQPGAGVVTLSTTTSSNPSATINTASGSTTSSSSGVTASATGTGTLSVAIYDSDPGGTHSFIGNDTYFDVYIAPDHAFTSLTILDCYLNGGTQVYWWNGSTWLVASNQTFNSSTGCATLTVTNSTSPGLGDLTGTPFAAAKPNSVQQTFQLFLPVVLR